MSLIDDLRREVNAAIDTLGRRFASTTDEEEKRVILERIDVLNGELSILNQAALLDAAASLATVAWVGRVSVTGSITVATQLALSIALAARTQRARGGWGSSLGPQKVSEDFFRRDSLRPTTSTHVSSCSASTRTPRTASRPTRRRSGQRAAPTSAQQRRRMS